jgi:2-octaprenyl-6-methoxyphenol hydroxylase
MAAQRSIVIGGGAFAGLALALALRQGLGADIPVIVADPALGLRPSRDPRATAIVAACRRLFEAIGVWDQVAAQAQPILDMVVTDSKLQDATRPVFLTFAGDVEPGEPFAHMIENRHLIDALVKRAEAEGIELRATAVATFDRRGQGIDVTLADGGVIEASLLVAADGARSKLRERAGIATHGWEYDQSGIVVTVGHERDHLGRAEEHFLPAARRWYGPRSVPRRRGLSRSARMNSTASWNSASGCISARSRRWISRAPFRSDILSRDHSSASDWRWSATPRM